MEILSDVLKTAFITPSTIQSIIIMGVVATIGLALAKIKLDGVSLGVTFVFFVGILFAYFGVKVDPTMLQWAMNFGLVLFIYALGVQVGPSFFPSLKRGGLVDNLLSLGMILLAVALCTGIYAVGVSMPNVLGIMSGAVTNTPVLAAAQSTLADVSGGVDATLLSEMAMACAMTYPFGVLGVILSLHILQRWAPDGVPGESFQQQHTAFLYEFEATNAAVIGKKIEEIGRLSEAHFVVSRIWRKGKVHIPSSSSVIEKGDRLLVVSGKDDVSLLEVFFGRIIEKDWNREDIDWDSIDKELVSMRIVMTQPEYNGVRLGALRLRNVFGINITRIDRAGIELLSTPDLHLQLGDRLTVVGEKQSVESVAHKLGNEIKNLEAPNLLSIFLGLVLSCLLGIIPFYLPGISMPIKLGLAGGAIMVGILMGAFGPRIHVTTYITNSAGLLIRQLGIVIYLGCLGLSSGAGFFDMLFGGNGFRWIAIGLIFAIVPPLLFGFLSMKVFKRSFSSTCGMICGSMANPMALEVMGEKFSDDRHNVSYATVYPLAMFLRIITAQLLILIFA